MYSLEQGLLRLERLFWLFVFFPKAKQVHLEVMTLNMSGTVQGEMCSVPCVGMEVQL